ncbi:ligand-binding sensor domain-containing protein [Ulvibacterium sp.]|uniref:ligand-binding sensor domain-containing protein n=1 Tax=Ulvibacterium sp. TaxID=2665914 RepID=UPI003BAA9CBB
MRFKTFILFCLFFLLARLSYGQKFKYAYYHGEEVPFKNVNRTIQDHEGYVWLATDQGLFRFDGNTFEDFNTTLRSKTIRSFVSWNKNDLLFTNDTGMHRVFYVNGQPKIESFKPNSALHYPTELFKDGQNRLWIGQMNGSIMMFSGNTDKGRPFDLVSKEKVPKMVFGEDKFGTIWVLAPGNGLFYFNESAQEFTSLKNYGSGNHFLIKDDIIWLAGEQLEKLKVTHNQNIINRQAFAVDGKLKYISMNDRGTLFLSSDSAIYTFQDQGDQTKLSKVFGANDPHRVEELSFGTVNQLQFTRDETGLDEVIWVGSDKGLALLWSSFFQGVSGLGHDNIRAINPSREGPIVISQGAVSWISSEGIATSFQKESNLNDIVGIGSLKDRIWYGSAEGQVFQYLGHQLKRTYDLSNRGSGVFFILADHAGDIWFCQAASDKPIIGAAKIDSKGNIIEYGKEKGFETRILVFREGGKDELYAAGIGLESYLYKYDRSSDSFQNKSLPFPFEVSGNFEVHDMAVDHLGIVWLATTDGLLKYDTETIRKVNLGVFTDSEIRSITDMPNGTLWLATDTNGLIHLDAKGNYVVFDETSGTPSKISSYRCMVLYENSQLWVGTPEGIVYSSRANPEPYQTKTPIIKRVSVDNDVIEGKSTIQPKESQKVELAMATLTFPSVDVRYQYKIFKSELTQEDIEDVPWSDAQTSQITLNELESGNYMVLVRGQKAGGFGWSAPVEMAIDVSQKWYGTWWGMLLLVALAFFFFWFFIRRWLLKRIEGLQASLYQKQKELEQKEAELVEQSGALLQKKNELKSTGVNIYLLYKLIRQIPRDSDWNMILPILNKLVELPTGIDVFELAFKKGEVVQFKGYQRENHEMVNREEPFDEKSNLPSYVMCTGKPLLIHDFNKEAEEHISKKDSMGYLSRIYMPLEQKVGGTAIFCVYSKEKNAFSQQTSALLGILVRFLSINASDGLK